MQTNRGEHKAGPTRKILSPFSSRSPNGEKPPEDRLLLPIDTRHGSWWGDEAEAERVSLGSAEPFSDGYRPASEEWERGVDGEVQRCWSENCGSESQRERGGMVKMRE